MYQKIQRTHFLSVEGARFALAKLPKKHIKHELDADLSTSGLFQFSSRILQMVLAEGVEPPTS